MEIRSDYLESLLRQEQTSRTVSTGKEGFGELLSQEIGRVGAQAEGTTPLPPGTGALIAEPVVVAEAEGGGLATDDALLRSLVGRTSGLLDAWDSYAATLERGGVRNAWDILSGMESTLRSVQATLDEIPHADAGLRAVINELEVLNATERFKFNRGDYV